MPPKTQQEEEAQAQAQATEAGLPYVNLQGFSIPRDVLTVIPESTARGHMIVAYEETEQDLKVATSEPADRQIVEFIQKKVNKPVTVAIASRASIDYTLNQYRQSLEMEIKAILADSQAVAKTDEDLSKVAEDLPIVRTVDLLLHHAIVDGVSDIHIEPLEKSVVFRFRIDGILHDVLTLPKEFLSGVVARIKVLANLKIDEHRLPQDGRFKIATDDYKVAFRVSILPVFDGEKVVMRLLDESGQGLGLDDIGMRKEVLEVFKRNVGKPNGMILVTGPTGSGKTTTLYAAMKELNKPEVNISTVEDPIEYRMTRINQTQVNSQIGLTFSNGLRALVRQDPDILMVGEIRDEETASLAVNAALTGHLVLSTLHTNSAAGALPRLLDMSVEAFLVASTVNLLVAQRLVRKLCEDCRKKAKIDPSLVSDLEKVMDGEKLLATLQRLKAVPAGSSLKDLEIFEPAGCNLCNDGYKGRMGIYEVIEFNDELQASITQHTTSDELQDKAIADQGMVTMIEDGFIKALEGVTSVQEVLRVAKE